MSTVLVLGTRNTKKREEIVEILGELDWQLRDLSEFAEVAEIVEDGSTFAENAAKKASGFAKALNQWVLGEDSGLVVPALGGRPGVRSARYAGTHGDDDSNNQKLLAELRPLSTDRRAAHYVCSAAIADPEGEIRATADASCHGVIVKELRGTNGFGYDPLFLILELHRTFGELSARVKHALSHRSRALERLRPQLNKLIRTSAANSAGRRGQPFPP